jgi:phage-related minor tail protein
MKLSEIVQEARYVQKTEGVREAAQAFDAMAKAQVGAAESAELVARQTTAQERAVTRIASKLEAYTRQHDPLTKALKDVERGEALIGAARARGIEVTSAHTAALEKARDRYRTLSGGVNDNSKSLKLNGAEWANLSSQIQDVFVTAYSGMNPLTIALQQGSQIFDVFSRKTGSALGGLRAMGAGALAVATHPLTLLAGAVGTVTASYLSFDSQQRALERSLNGVGRAAGVTADELRRVGQIGANRAGMSDSEGIAAASQLAASGRLRAGTIAGIVGGSRRYARAFGLDEADALKELGEAFADPTKGAELLNRRFGDIDAAGRDLIKTLQDQGNLYGAQVELLNRFNAGISKTTDTTMGLVKAWELLKAGFMSPVQTIGGAIDNFFAKQPSAQDVIRRRAEARRLAREQEAVDRSNQASDLIARTVPSGGARRDLVNQQARLALFLGDPEVRKRLGNAAEDADKALEILTTRVNNWKSAVDQAREDTALAVAEIGARSFAERSAVASQKAYVETLRQTGDVTRAAVAAEGERQKLLAESARKAQDMLRSANDNAALSGLLPFDRAMREIDFKYRDARRDLVPNAATPMAREFDTAATAARNVTEAFNGLASKISTDGQYRGGVVGLRAAALGSDLHRSIIKAEGTDKYGDPYNTSLGYTRSPKPLTSMTMAESLEWGDHIRKGTDIGRRTNSSAKGAFQIVNSTQRAAMKALNFGPNEMFDEGHQRAMADWIFKTQGIGAWEGFKRPGLNDNGPRRVVDVARGSSSATPDISGTLRSAEEAERAAKRFEFIQKPLQDANAEIERQRALLNSQATAFGQSAEATARAAKQQELLNQFQQQGVPITDALRGSIAATAENYGRLVAEQERLEKSQRRLVENLDLVRSSARDALGGFVSDMMRGESAAKSLESQLSRIADRLISMAAERAIEDIFGKMGTGNMAGGGGFFNFLKSIFPFAEGGVMTSRGSIPLRTYSRGGVANSPQLSLFGEGRTPEAYVPLPDGRTIPVTMRAQRGASAPANSNSVAPVTVNLIGAPQGTQVKETVDKQGGRRIDVVMREQWAAAAGSPMGQEALRAGYGARPALTRR